MRSDGSWRASLVQPGQNAPPAAKSPAWCFHSKQIQVQQKEVDYDVSLVAGALLRVRAGIAKNTRDREFVSGTNVPGPFTGWREFANVSKSMEPHTLRNFLTSVNAVSAADERDNHRSVTIVAQGLQAPIS